VIYRASLALGALVVAVLMARWFEEGDYFDPVRQRRHCAAPPSAVKDWSYTGRTRRASDLANLDRWLRDHPDDVNRLFGAFCQTPLHAAARFGREDLAERLIALGADVRARDEPRGQTALHLAAQYGHADVAALLVARGSDVNAVGLRDGRTPLHDAAFGLAGTSDLEGRVAVATLLLSHGADINARAKGNGRTPLDEAASASSNAAHNQRMTELLLAAGAAANTRDSAGVSVLQQAASRGDVAGVRLLLDRGADPNVGGRDTTPLGSAAYEGQVEVVQLLLARGADPNPTLPTSRMEGNGAPLAMALMPARGVPAAHAERRRLEVAALLLDRGADIDARDRQNRTVLHAAASRGQLGAVELLLAHGAAINAVDAVGLTPLHLAIKEGHIVVASRLLDRGADASLRARDGTRAFDLAGDDPEMERLVRRHARP
jgi:ankyrin repeat protein